MLGWLKVDHTGESLTTPSACGAVSRLSHRKKISKGTYRQQAQRDGADELED